MEFMYNCLQYKSFPTDLLGKYAEKGKFYLSPHVPS